MPRLRRLAVSIVTALATDPHTAVAQSGCISMYIPQGSPATTGVCAGGIVYTYYLQQFDCTDPSSTCSSTPLEFGAWAAANKPSTLAERCNNPWAPIDIDCSPKPEPDQCSSWDPRASKAAELGDPVDLTTGALEQSAADLDLGSGLRFRRAYASNRSRVEPMGLGWRSSLDWRLHYRSGITPPSAEIVTVLRPLATSTAFVKSPPVTPDWTSGMRGSGTLSGSEPSGFTYVDEDGTHVAFDRIASQTFEVAEIVPPGGPAISVSRAGNTTTYSAAGRSLAVSTFASGTNAGQIASVSGGGQTWTYTYDSNDRLLTATGPDLSTPGNTSDQVVWTYTYSGGLMSKVQRSAGGTTRTLGDWTYTSGRVASADETALDQKLYL